MKFTESMLDGYSQPLSDTEDAKCKNAIRMVGDSLKNLGFKDDDTGIYPLYPDTLAYSLRMKTPSGRSVKLFVQGSYANNTNVRTHSDVDIAVVQEDIFTTKYRDSSSIYPQSDADYHFTTVQPSAKSFKDEVQECLEQDFGDDVERKNKSIKVHGNTYRKDADTVPCRRYRDYRKDYLKNPDNYIGGIVITPDRGPTIINYPEQHIANGREKNEATHHHYKKMVRIMKKMRYLMADSTISTYASAANNVSSFLLESLLWNVDNQWYLDNCGKYRKVYAFHLLIQLLDSSRLDYMQYKEANGIKPLCENETVKDNLCAFINQLKLFYDYE